MKRKGSVNSLAAGMATLAMATTVSTPAAWASHVRSASDNGLLDAQTSATSNEPSPEQEAAHARLASNSEYPCEGRGLG